MPEPSGQHANGVGVINLATRHRSRPHYEKGPASTGPFGVIGREEMWGSTLNSYRSAIAELCHLLDVVSALMAQLDSIFFPRIT